MPTLTVVNPDSEPARSVIADLESLGWSLRLQASSNIYGQTLCEYRLERTGWPTLMPDPTSFWIEDSADD